MIQPLLIFLFTFKFFIGLFALANPGGDYPCFQHDQLPDVATARNKTNPHRESVGCDYLGGVPYSSATASCNLGISIGFVQNCGRYPVVTIAMSMIRREAGEDKTSKKVRDALRESIGGCAVSAAVNGGAKRPPSSSSGDALSQHRAFAWLFSCHCAFALCCWGVFRMALWLVRLLGQTGINVITRITMGLLLMALGIEFIVTE